MASFGVRGFKARERMPKGLNKLCLKGFGFGVGPTFGGSRWTPGQLFAAGEQGGWYEASDLSSMYQDSAGNSSVTAVGQPVGLMLDKRIARGPQLLSNGTFDTNVNGWTAFATNSAIAWDAGALQVSRPASGLATGYSQITTVIGMTYLVQGTVTAVVGGPGFVYLGASNLTTSASGLGLSNTTPSTGPKSFVFTATATTTYIHFAIDNNTGVSSADLDNVTVQAIPGNHLSQATTTSRPILKALYNKLTKTESFTGWGNNGTSLTASGTEPGGRPAFTITADGANSVHFINLLPGAIGGNNKLSVLFKAGTGNFAQLLFGNTVSFANFDLQNGILGTTGGADFVSATITAVSGGWYLCSITSNNAGSTGAGIGLASSAGDVRAQTFISSATIQCAIPDWRLSADATLGIPSYQRVDTTSSYDTAGFPMYLEFDGVDDSLASASTIAFSSGQMTVFAGLRKSLDSVAGVLAELSAASASNNGAFGLYAPGVNADADYYSDVRGTVLASEVFTPFAAPIASVLTLEADVTAATVSLAAKLRVNAVGQVGAASGAGPAGTTFGTYTLFVGARNSASVFFTGRLYGLIVRGSSTTAAQIALAERYVGSKMGITL